LKSIGKKNFAGIQLKGEKSFHGGEGGGEGPKTNLPTGGGKSERSPLYNQP